ncbi:PH domain-containing protein [Nocardia lasii]|uniref:PH domain-containing protein n=1 Tax=Nocardia lasii TaxID=1616107 RepID=A0ABW1JR35_9NOCA
MNYLRPDIAQAKSKMSSKLGAGRELKKLAGYLWEAETVDLLASGWYGSGTGLVALTDRRLIFIKDGIMSQTLEDFPLENISSVQWSAGMLFGTMTVFTSGNKADISQMQKPDGKAIADKIRQLISAPTDPPTEPSHPSTQSPSIPPTLIADELRKLAELRELGVLTDDEFTAQKAKLLAQ